jgi:hypothetical protein
VRPQTVDLRELEDLPAPVERYFCLTLKEEQPMVASVRVRHSGTFNMGETTDQWKPFTSDQEVVTQRPGFDWNGSVAMIPGVPVRVHDAYVAGEGFLHASLLGLFSLVNMRGGGDVAEGELMRFFAEAAWYPTVLLPSQGVRWEAADDRSAYATLTEGTTSITMLFTFDEQGLIESVGTEARGRTVGGEVVPTPGRVASGTTKSVAECRCRPMAKWPGCYPRIRSLTGEVASSRSTTSSRSDRGLMLTGNSNLGE